MQSCRAALHSRRRHTLSIAVLFDEMQLPMQTMYRATSKAKENQFRKFLHDSVGPPTLLLGLLRHGGRQPQHRWRAAQAGRTRGSRAVAAAPAAAAPGSRSGCPAAASVGPAGGFATRPPRLGVLRMRRGGGNSAASLTTAAVDKGESAARLPSSAAVTAGSDLPLGRGLHARVRPTSLSSPNSCQPDGLTVRKGVTSGEADDRRAAKAVVPTAAAAGSAKWQEACKRCQHPWWKCRQHQVRLHRRQVHGHVDGSVTNV